MQLNLIGQTLGKYRILEEIGRGGMGVVYKAHDSVLDRLVAIKILAPYLTWDQEFVRRFLNEARVAARLKHHHIVTIYDIGEMQGHHFIAMEYLEGRSLAEIIRREGALPAERVAHLLAQIAQALDYAHAQGLIHRDVKPGNVIISPQDQATLTDFGVAKALAGTRLTQSGVMVGTPAYMSPEQVKQQPVGPAADVYALGVVAYEMLGGRPPFEGDTPHVLYAHVYEEPRPLWQVNSKIPPPVGAVVQKALAKEPGKRYGSAEAFAAALGQAVGSRETEVIRKPPLPRSPSLPTARVSQIPLWPLFGALLAVLIVVLMVFWLVTNKPDEQAVATQTAVAHAATQTAAAAATEAVVAQPTATQPAVPTATPTEMEMPTPTPTETPTATRMETPTVTHTATLTPTASPTITPRPGIAVGGYVQVTSEVGLNLRDGPGTDYKERTLLADDAVLKVIEGPEQADGSWWWRLEDLTNGTLGWAADEYLVATAVPTATPKPTATPTATKAATHTPTPTPPSITLLEPANGAYVSGPVTFRWTWPGGLRPSETLDVKVCKGKGCQPRFGKTNTWASSWDWCPDEGEGIYRWQVEVIDNATKQPTGPASGVWEFTWVGTRQRVCDACINPATNERYECNCRIKCYPPVITLFQPSNGAIVSGWVTFRWIWSGEELGSGEVFDVKVCKGKDCWPEFGITNTRNTTPDSPWCPDADQGVYRWLVEVIDSNTKQPTGPASEVWEFTWVGTRQRVCDTCTDPITLTTYECNCRIECH